MQADRFKEISKTTLKKIFKQLLYSNYGIPNDKINDSCRRILIEELNSAYEVGKKESKKTYHSDMIYNRAAGQERGE